MPWSGMDQRRFPRIRHQCTVSLRQTAGRPSVSVMTENVGSGGLCVLLDRGLDIFSPVDVELSLDDGQSPVACRGMIAWVVRRRELNRPTMFDTGIEFVDLSSDDQARLTKELAVAARLPEGRRAP